MNYPPVPPFQYSHRYSHADNSGGPPPWSNPLTDPMNWEIRMEWETIRDGQGRVIRQHQVQRAYYKPRAAMPAQLPSQVQQPSMRNNGKLMVISLLVLFPILPGILLFVFLILGVVLSLLSQALSLVIPALLLAGGAMLWFRRRARRKKGVTGPLSTGRGTQPMPPMAPPSASWQQQRQLILPDPNKPPLKW